MDPKLNRYLLRLYSHLKNRWFIVDDSNLNEERLSGTAVKVAGRLEIIDGSILYFTEVVIMKGNQPIKVDYSYQFRTENEPGFFRCDPESHGRPEPYHHKHVYNQPIRQVESAPDLFDILREIDSLLFSE